jgi:hypothetical protein
LAHGSHSEAIIATRIGIDRIVRARRTITPGWSAVPPPTGERV